MAPLTSPPDDERSGPSWRRWGGLLLAVVFFAAGAWFLLRQRETLAAGIEVDARFLLPLAFAEAAMLAVRGLLTRELCRPFGVSLRVVEAVALASWTTLANYLAPLVGGAGTRAVYLKRRHGLPYAHFVSIHAGTYAILFAIGAVFGLAALWLLPQIPAAARGMLGLLFGAALASCALLLFFPRWLGWVEALGGRRVARVSEGARLLLSSGRRGAISILLVLNLLALSLSLFSSFRLLGISLSAVEAVFLAAVTNYSVLLSITPASFGITESVIVFAGGLLGVAGAMALAAAAVKRLSSLAVTALFAGSAALLRKGTPKTGTPKTGTPKTGTPKN